MLSPIPHSLNYPPLCCLPSPYCLPCCLWWLGVRGLSDQEEKCVIASSSVAMAVRTTLSSSSSKLQPEGILCKHTKYIVLTDVFSSDTYLCHASVDTIHIGYVHYMKHSPQITTWHLSLFLFQSNVE